MSTTKILEMPANDLIGRLVLNPHGAEFVVTALTLDAEIGDVLIWVDVIDEVTRSLAGTPCGLLTLKGWSVANKIPRFC